MKRFVLVLSMVFLLLSFAAAEPQKVILDTDMVDCFDDGIAMLVLDNSENIDLLGVTIVAGNNSMPNCTASAVYQLMVSDSDTPVYQGSRVPFRYFRLDPEVMAAEQLIAPSYNNGGYLNRWARDWDVNQGKLEMDPMSDWKDVYEAIYGSEPTYQYVYGPENPDASGNKDAVDFMIDQVNKYPGEIIIAAIGPCTNVARAILQDPTFPSKVKAIVYMGGAFFVPGNSSAAAELNWWLDPEAAKVCVRTQWGDPESETYAAYGNQVISGLEANVNTGAMPQDLFEKVLEETWPGIRELFDKKNGGIAPSNIWDVFAAAYIVDPSIVLSWNNDPRPESGEPDPITGVYIDVNAEMGPDYGRAIAYSADRGHAKNGPNGSRKAAIQSFIDEDKFWNEIVYPALTNTDK